MTMLSGCELGKTRDESTVLVGTVCSALEGPLISPIVGNGIGQLVDIADFPDANEAFEKATRVSLGQKVYWQNEATAHWGSYVPVRDCPSERGEYCREFVTCTYIDRKRVESHGKACRRTDGSWYMS